MNSHSSDPDPSRGDSPHHYQSDPTLPSMIIGPHGELLRGSILVQDKAITDGLLQEFARKLSEAIHDIGRMYRIDERSLSVLQEFLVYAHSYNLFELSRMFLSERDVFRGYHAVNTLLQEYLVDPFFFSESVQKAPDYDLRLLEEASETMQQFALELEMLITTIESHSTDDFHLEVLSSLRTHVRNHELIAALELYRSANDIISLYPQLHTHLKEHWGQGHRLLQALKDKQN